MRGHLSWAAAGVLPASAETRATAAPPHSRSGGSTDQCSPAGSYNYEKNVFVKIVL